MRVRRSEWRRAVLPRFQAHLASISRRPGHVERASRAQRDLLPEAEAPCDTNTAGKAQTRRRKAEQNPAARKKSLCAWPGRPNLFHKTARQSSAKLLRSQRRGQLGTTTLSSPVCKISHEQDEFKAADLVCLKRVLFTTGPRPFCPGTDGGRSDSVSRAWSGGKRRATGRLWLDCRGQG